MIDPGAKVLTVGLELHRVFSHKKLFCDCSYVRTKNAPFEWFETEYPREKKINRYRHTYTQYCGYEKDERPPVLCEKTFKNALKIVKNIPGIKIPRKILFNRKHIIDGSIPKGYQISAVLGYDGSITLNNGREVKVVRVYLEEDSCTYVRCEGQMLYDTARCGLPLLEVVTAPAVLNAAEVKQLMQKIECSVNKYKNLYYSSFCIRQDINLSASDRSTKKIEIKGVDSLSAVGQIFELTTEDFLTNNGGLTLKFRPETNDFSVLRHSSSVERLHPQTDLTLAPAFEPKAKDLWSQCAPVKNLQPHLSAVIKNKNHLRKITRWVKKYSLTQKDLLTFINLCGPLGKKVYSWYERYLRDECSLEGLKKNLLVKPRPVDELTDLYRKYTPQEFYKHHKLQIPRSFKPPL